MESFFSLIANCRVRWQDLPGTGIPLVFVHGLGCASSYEYPRIVADKAFQGRRAILIDLPGCGYSEKPKDYTYAIKEQACVVAEVIAHLGLSKCFLYGHSMGGSICIEAATLLADNLCGLIVSEPNFHRGGGMFSRQICLYDEDKFESAIYEDMIEQEGEPWAGSLSVDAPWAVWRGAASLIKGNTWLEMFSILNKPKLLIFGENSLPDDDFTIVEGLEIMTAILPKCGHSMSWENPAALGGALAEFCKTLERRVLE